ncbi:Txe/YoeB family addiction module toxin [Breznakiellaceae bacterium SP9]
MSKLLWQELGWEGYQFWIAEDKQFFKKLNALLKDISRNGNTGIGKPEPLSEDKSGWWSRRIDEQNRIVYRLLGNDTIEIRSCKGHYDDK